MFKDKNSWGIDGQKCLLVMYDAATGYIASCPLQEKTADSTVECYLDLMGNQKIKHLL